jgi:hypothetical protein
MLIATRLTDDARKYWAEYLATHVNSERAAYDILQDIEQGGNHGVDDFMGCNYEIRARYSATGNPNPINVPPDNYVWERADI